MCIRDRLSSIKMDLFRRDFTINAMALRLNKGQFGCLVDFFGGQSDIQRKPIRIIHALSFVEMCIRDRPPRKREKVQRIQ